MTTLPHPRQPNRKRASSTRLHFSRLDGHGFILQTAINAHRSHNYARPDERYRHLPNNARNPIIINPSAHPAAPTPAIPQQSRSSLVGRNRNQIPSDTNTIDNGGNAPAATQQAPASS